MKTTSTQKIHRFRKQWVLSVFIALVIYSCGTSPSPPSTTQQKLPAQEKQKADESAYINTQNSKGFTLLHEAIRNKDLVIARMLIERGADVNLFSRSKMNPLYFAADCGQVEMIKLLLEAGALIDAKSISGLNPLLIATYRGHTHAVAELIRSGADVNVATDQNWTALHSAAAGGHTEILELLIENGADVNTEQFPDTVLHWAAIKGHAEAAMLLIQHGAIVDKRNLTGAMPLHLAISYSHTETVKVLLDNGANPNSVAGNGFTPLLTAHKWPGVKNREPMALLLRLYGAE